jgi:hypothetical protein
MIGKRLKKHIGESDEGHYSKKIHAPQAVVVARRS